MAIPEQLANWYQGTKSTKSDGLLATTATPMTNSPTTNNDLTKVTAAKYDADQAPIATYKPAQLGNPATWDITKQQTSAGQLDSIIAKDSPLMQMAKTKGLQQANQRGLLNSSMGIGAAQDSVIAAATPLAQADADIYSKAAAYNTDTKNTFSKLNFEADNAARQFNANAENQGNQFNVTASNSAKEFNATAVNRAKEFNASNEFNKNQELFKANVEASLKQIENEYDFDKEMLKITGGMSNDMNKLWLQLQQDTNMNQQSKDYTWMQAMKMFHSQLSMLSAIGSIPDVSDLLELEFIDTSSSTARQTNIPKEFQGL